MTFFQRQKILVTLLATLFFIGCQSPETEAQSTETNSEAQIVLVEYSDFQCPACAYYYPIVERLKEHYGDQLVVKYRYFPLNSHQYAMLAARAAEAARNQSKFGEMQHLLFTNQKQWAGSSNPQAIFIDYARQIGLDVDQFKEDLNSAETQRTVMEQKKEGIEKGVASTPSFFVNGEKMIRLPRNYAEFKALLDIYLEEAQGETAN